MDCPHSKARMNAEDDRLSMFPDDLIHKILSYISIKQAVQTSALCSRWRFIWTSMPDLNISTDDFKSFSVFSDFVNRVLLDRNNQIEIYSVNLTFHQTFSLPEAFNKSLFKQILDYAFSHNVQQLTVTCLLDDEIEFPIYLFSSSSLKYLRLTGRCISFRNPYSLILASTWDLSALTTLHLDYVACFEDSLFSKCANLKNLTLSNFRILKSNTFTLCHPQLSNLTLEKGYWTLESFNVVAPQLKNLTIGSRYGKHLITAPNLVSLLFHSTCYLKFSTDLCFLEKVDFCSSDTYKWSDCGIFDLLQQIHNVKFLTVNLEFIAPLILYKEEISLLPSPFSNLKSLKIYPIYVPSDDKRVILCTEVLNYFLDGSPSVTFTLISYEDLKEKQQKALANANAVKAQRLMTNLQVMLEKEKANIETNSNRMRRMDMHEENSTDDEEENDTNNEGKVAVMQLQLKKKMAQIKRRWKDVGAQIDKGKRNTDNIISELRDIELLLLKDLPASKRDELQSRYSSLCEEVDSFVKKTLHLMMIAQLQLSDCFNELASTSILPS